MESRRQAGLVTAPENRGSAQAPEDRDSAEAPEDHAPGVGAPDPRRGIVSYARRGERRTAGQRRAWPRLWPRFGVTLDDLNAAGGLDLAGWFGREAPLL